MINQDFITYLLTKSTITDLVGTRIFVAKIPDATTARPAITVQKISDVHLRHHGGLAGVATTRLQLDVWGATSTSVDAVAEAVRLVLDGAGQVTMDGTKVIRTFLDGDNDVYSQAIDASDQGEFRVSQDWIVWHAEDTPG